MMWKKITLVVEKSSLTWSCHQPSTIVVKWYYIVQAVNLLIISNMAFFILTECDVSNGEYPYQILGSVVIYVKPAILLLLYT